jgi:DNA (cytosine-5)-methyltransferase 1
VGELGRKWAYYNENDLKTAAWLRELIKAKLIADGEVDTRSIVDVQPADVRGFVQCHFFAGIGGWSHALRLAGWGDERPCWTGSCPCQPWSDANVWQGGGQGDADPRHLWPAWFRLIEVVRPDVVFGEQVASAVRRGWLDEVFSDLERLDYACGPVGLPASSVGADHGRRRVWWVADAHSARWEGHQPVECVPIAASAALTISRDAFVRARRAVAGDYSDLLPCDGLSVQLERDALRGYGNAIVPECAAEVIAAYMEIANG